MNIYGNIFFHCKKISSLIFLYGAFIGSSLLIITDEVGAVAQEKPADVVYKLYKDYAWQTVVQVDKESYRIFGKGIQYESRAVLEKYFDTELTALFLTDVKYTKLTGEYRNLSIDPIFAVQDIGVTDLKIHPYALGNVLVEFTYMPDASKISLIYKVKQYPKGWRITDIVYKSSNGSSLKKILLGSETALKMWNKNQVIKTKGSAS